MALGGNSLYLLRPGGVEPVTAPPLEISLVVPTFRGETYLPGLLEEIRIALGNRTYEVILVDDGGGAESRRRLEEIASQRGEVRLVSYPDNRGQQAATTEGLKRCRGNILVTLDDDGQQNPGDLPALITLLQEGRDLVYGVPVRGGGQPIRRRIGSAARDWLFTRLLGAPRGLRISSFRIFTRDLWGRASAGSWPSFIYLSALLLEQRPDCCHREVVFRDNRSSRYRLVALLRLYGRLFYHYGGRRMFGER